MGKWVQARRNRILRVKGKMLGKEGSLLETGSLDHLTPSPPSIPRMAGVYSTGAPWEAVSGMCSSGTVAYFDLTHLQFWGTPHGWHPSSCPGLIQRGASAGPGSFVLCRAPTMPPFPSLRSVPGGSFCSPPFAPIFLPHLGCCQGPHFACSDRCVPAVYHTASDTLPLRKNLSLVLGSQRCGNQDSLQSP